MEALIHLHTQWNAIKWSFTVYRETEAMWMKSWWLLRSMLFFIGCTQAMFLQHKMCMGAHRDANKAMYYCAGKTTGARDRFRLRSKAPLQRRTWRSSRRERLTSNSWRYQLLVYQVQNYTFIHSVPLFTTCPFLSPSSPGRHYGRESDLQGLGCDDPRPGRDDW